MAEGDVVTVHVVGRYQQQNIVTTLHYKVANQTKTNHEILPLLLSQWQTKFLSAWLARHLDSYTLVGLKGFGLTGGNKRPAVLVIGDPGVVTGEEMPAPCCRTITLYTDSDNHWRRGRVMLSGTATTMIDQADNSVTDAEVTALATLADLFLDPLEDDEELWQPCLPAGSGVGGAYPIELFKAALPRKTPSYIRSRRVRGFNIG